jgi:hypothetical protein
MSSYNVVSKHTGERVSSLWRLIVVCTIIFVLTWLVSLRIANAMTKGLSTLTDERSFKILNDKQSCLDAGYQYVDYQYTFCGFFGCAKGDFMGCNAIRNNPQCSNDGKICYNNGPNDALKCKENFLGLCAKWSID